MRSRRVAELARDARDAARRPGRACGRRPSSATGSRARRRRCAARRRGGRDRCGRATSCASRRGAGRSRSRAPRPHCSPNLTPMSSPHGRPDFDLDADAYRRRIRVHTTEPGVVVSRARRRLPPLRGHAAPRRRARRCRARTRRTAGRGRRAPTRPNRCASSPACRSRAASPRPARGPIRSRTARTSSTPRATRSRTRRRDRDERVYDLEIPRRDPETGETRRAALGRRRAAPRVDDRLGRHRRSASRRSTPRRGGAASCAGPTRRCPKTTPSARSCCGARATSAWAAAWTSTACPSPTSCPQTMAGICHTMQPGVVRRRVPPRRLDPRFRARPDRLLTD